MMMKCHARQKLGCFHQQNPCDHAKSSHLPQISDAVFVGTLQEVVPVIKPAKKHREEDGRWFPPHLQWLWSKGEPGRCRFLKKITADLIFTSCHTSQTLLVEIV